MIDIPRRGFIGGLIGIIAAPAIVRIQNIMPVKALPVELSGPYFEMKFADGFSKRLPFQIAPRLNADGDMVLMPAHEVSWDVDASRSMVSAAMVVPNFAGFEADLRKPIDLHKPINCDHAETLAKGDRITFAPHATWIIRDHGDWKIPSDWTTTDA